MSQGRPADYRANARRILTHTPGVRDSVGSATRSFDAKRRAAFAAIDGERWKDWARDAKAHTLTHLDQQLEQAEGRLLERGVHVHWA